MVPNKFLMDFDAEKLDELTELNERYERFRALAQIGKIDEALQIDLPYEDDRREMGGVVGKIYKAITDIRRLAKDSIDDSGALRDETFRQFRWCCFGSVLYNCFDLMTCDYYRNIGYVYGTDSKFGVIREPLFFFNECWDNLFRWIVRDLKCRLFESAWDAWRTYLKYCEDFGHSRVGGVQENSDVTCRTMELQQEMIYAFNDLSEKHMPQFSSEPVSVEELSNATQKLIKDGSAFLNPTAKDRVGTCLDNMTKIANACLRSKEWGLLSNALFIRFLVHMTQIKDCEIFDDESERFEDLWRGLRNVLDTYLIFLSEQVVSQEIKRFRDWLSHNRAVTKDKSGSSLKRIVRGEVVVGLREECLKVVLSVHDVRDSKQLRLLYAGDTTRENDDGCFLKLRSEDGTADVSVRTGRIAFAREMSPFFPRSTMPQIPEEKTKLMEDCLRLEDKPCEWPKVSDEQLLELGGDQRVVDYINSDPVVIWRYPYYQYLLKRKEYLAAGYTIDPAAEEHLVAFLTTTFDEYDADFAERFRSDPKEYRYQTERHDSYKQKYIYDVYGKFDQELTRARKEQEAARIAQAEKAREDELLAKGRQEGVAAAAGLQVPIGSPIATPISVLIAGYTSEGRRQAIEITNTKQPVLKGLFMNVHLAKIYDVHVNTIANWLHGKSAPEGFIEAYQSRDYEDLILSAAKYRSIVGKCDVMNTKAVVRNITDELMKKLGAQLPGMDATDSQ